MIKKIPDHGPDRDQNQIQDRNQDQEDVPFHQHHRKYFTPYFLIKLLFFCFSGRAAQAPQWDGESGYRLHVSPLNPRTSRRDIEKIFSKFGQINEVYFMTKMIIESIFMLNIK